MRITDEGTVQLARQMFPALERAGMCLARGNHLAAQNDEPEPDVTTGWPPSELMQDDCRDLSRALANKPDARLHAREAAVAIEAERIDRGPLTVPAELTDEATWLAFDLARNVDKGQKWHRQNDQHAADLQLQYQGCIGELPR